ncbi:hypothetical protein GCM10022243_02830 [Saccharothrix violaceirubra]|uniref:Uncharacterized protein n=1 Tax=Saccharothrix violaceirubra TaxID=413306 RepID=A0A7W7SZW1_9PSEU|nr:hypothetical protein [Saccharothrix violaceirubra]MBB4964033.1 hypothetical protein [Saccharothrix violaceirubra]
MIGRTALTRRGLLLALAAAPLAAACTTPPPQPPPPDALEPLLRAARSDAALAEAVGAPETAAARTEHAKSLQAELDRAMPRISGSPVATTTAVSATPPANATREALITAIKAAQKQAVDLLPGVPTYRAGLVGSIAAGCASLLEVLS